VLFVVSFWCGGLSVSQSGFEAEISEMGMSETSFSPASSPPLVESKSLASSSLVQSGSASFPCVFFVADVKPSSGAEESYLCQPIQAPYCSLNPHLHHSTACLSHFVAD